MSKTSRIRLGVAFGLAVWRNRPVRYLILCGALLIAAIVAGTAIMVDNLRDRALFDSERELKNTALILAEQIDRTFQAVDLVQISVIERIQSLGITSSDDYARRISSTGRRSGTRSLRRQIGRHRRRLVNQGNGDTAVGSQRRRLLKKRIGVGLAGDVVNVGGGITRLF